MVRSFSNCWIVGIIIYLRFKNRGAKLVFRKTERNYKWGIQFSHCYVKLKNGRILEFVPIKDTLGDYPPPFFKGKIKRR